MSLKPLCVSPLTGSSSCLCLWPAALCHRRHVWCGVSGTSFTVMVLVINLNFTKIPFILTWSCISHLKSPLRWILDNLMIIISISMFMTSLCAGIHDVLSSQLSINHRRGSGINLEISISVNLKISEIVKLSIFNFGLTPAQRPPVAPLCKGPDDSQFPRRWLVPWTSCWALICPKLQVVRGWEPIFCLLLKRHHANT